MKIRLLLLFPILFLPFYVRAQQDAQFSQYMFNQLYLNPAFAGVDPDWTDITIIHRSQWVGYSPTFDDGGAPNTQVLSASIPLTKYNLGLGLHLVNDNLGPLNTTEAQLSLAYHLKLKTGSVSFGLRSGLYNHAIDFDRLRFVNPDDPLNTLQGRQSQIVGDFAAGVYYNSSRYFGGVSINHLQQSDFNYGTDLSTNALTRHMNAIFGTNIELSRELELTPSAIIKSDFNSFSFEGSIIATYDQRYFGGISMRETEAAILILGLAVLDQKLRFSYAFDYTMKARNAKETTSHEILVRYRLPSPKFLPPPVIRTPRFRHQFKY